MKLNLHLVNESDIRVCSVIKEKSFCLIIKKEEERRRGRGREAEVRVFGVVGEVLLGGEER